MNSPDETLWIGLLAMLVGASGWLLPARWNLLRLKRSLAARVPERFNQLLPKVLGSGLLVVGLAMTLAGLQMRLSGEEPAEPSGTRPQVVASEDAGAAAGASDPGPLGGEDSQAPPESQPAPSSEPPFTEPPSTEPTSEQAEALFRALAAGDRQQVLDLLAAGVDPSHRSSSGTWEAYTPLHMAVDYGHPELLRVLLDAGAEIDARGPSGFTPLLMAVNAEEKEMVLELLRRGADPDARETGEGLSSLTMALAYGDPSLVPALLEAGADPNLETHAGHNALDYASPESSELRRLLLEAGAVASDS